MFSLTAKSGTIASCARSAGTSGIPSLRASATSVHSLERLRQPDGPGGVMAWMSGDHVGQLVHPVPGEPGDTEDLAAVDVQVERRAGGGRGRRAAPARPASPGARPPGPGKSGSTSAPTISCARPRWSTSDTGSVCDDAPGAQDRDAVGDLEDLVQAGARRRGRWCRSAAPPAPSRAAARPRRGGGPRSARRARARRRLRASPAARPRSRRPSAGRASPRRAGYGCRSRRRSARGSGRSPGPARPANAAAEAADEVAPQREVVHRVQLEHQPEVLVDEAKPVGHVVTERERLARELGDGTRVGGVVAGERLDQRRLSGAVLSDKRVDFALADLDRRVDQRPCSGKRLRKALHAQRRCGGTDGIAGGGFGDQGFLSGLDGLSAVVSELSSRCSTRNGRRGIIRDKLN